MPSLAAVIAPSAPGNEFTALLVPEGSGTRLALDRDGDGYYDTSEADLSFNSADPASHPGRIVSISRVAASIVIAWESAPGARYSVLRSTNILSAPAVTAWTSLGPAFTAVQPITFYTNTPSAGVGRQFYRVRLEP